MPDVVCRYQPLLDKLGVSLGDTAGLDEAFRHSSYSNEQGGRPYERLEFLGDSVIELAVSHYLYKRYPDALQGELSRLRARCVSGERLCEVAKTLSLERYLSLGEGQKSDRKGMERILADTFEALFGVLYLELGLSAVYGKLIELLLEDSPDEGVDYKTWVQETFQRLYHEEPRYEVKEREKKAGRKSPFLATLWVNGAVFCSAEGDSKKEAKKQCAKKAWEKLRRKE